MRATPVIHDAGPGHDDPLRRSSMTPASVETTDASVIESIDPDRADRWRCRPPPRQPGCTLPLLVEVLGPPCLLLVLARARVLGPPCSKYRSRSRARGRARSPA